MFESNSPKPDPDESESGGNDQDSQNQLVPGIVDVKIQFSQDTGEVSSAQGTLHTPLGCGKLGSLNADEMREAGLATRDDVDAASDSDIVQVFADKVNEKQAPESSDHGSSGNSVSVGSSSKYTEGWDNIFGTEKGNPELN